VFILKRDKKLLLALLTEKGVTPKQSKFIFNIGSVGKPFKIKNKKKYNKTKKKL